jgi:hypothetical protein
MHNAINIINLNKKIAELEVKRDNAKNVLKTLTDKHPRVACGGMLIYVQHRKGAINYEEIPELKDVDLNRYRKPPSEFISFRSRKK